MKGLVAGFLLLNASTAFAQAPDGRDSVILESKVVAPNLNGSPAFTVKVYITNKDSLAGFTLPVELKTVSGPAFVLLAEPRDFAGTINRLTSTLGQNLTFSDFVNDSSPDSAIWAGFWNPNNRNTAERPNAARKAIWEIKFKHSSDSLGDVHLDSAVIFDNRVHFVDLFGNEAEVNFVKGIVRISDAACPLGGCLGAGGDLLFGRAYSRDFDTGCPGGWSVASGPGTIDPGTGEYNFSGQCALGAVPVNVRFTPNAGSTSDCPFTINVTDNPPACSPAQITITVSHGQTAANQINASDPNAGDGFVFSKLSGPGSVNAGGAWSYPTGCSDVAASPYTIRIKTADAFGSCNPGPLADTCEFQLIVTNAAPSVANCPADVLPVDTGAAFSLQLTGADADFADAGSLQFFLASGPAGLTVSSSGLVQWTPTGSQSGLRSATVQVRDGCGVNTNCQINFAVSVRKGDLNADGNLSPTDFVYLLSCIYRNSPPPAGMWACDLNCDGQKTGLDVVLQLYAVFLGRDFPC